MVRTKITLPPTFCEGFHDLESVEKISYHPLGETGLLVSALGIGGGALGGFFGSIDEEEAENAVIHALKCGLNFLDTSPWYGDTKSESILGKILKKVPRNAYYIATKVGRYKPETAEMFDFSAEATIESVNNSLDRSGLNYVDLIQVHDLEFADSLDIILNETLPALEEVRKSGKAKFIGITGYPVKTLLEVVQKSPVKIDTVLSYCRFGVFNNDYLQIIPDLKKRGVGIINASPIGMGLLSEKGPPDWHPAPDDLKDACSKAVQYSNDHGVDLKLIALKLCYESQDISTTLVSMERTELVDVNLKTFSQKLTEKEREIYKDVAEKFFKPLDKTHWEGVEVAEYRRKLANLKAGNSG